MGSVLGICIILPLFILVNIMISTILYCHIIHCYNITLITKCKINICNIEVITNNHLGVSNRRLSPIYILSTIGVSRYTYNTYIYI